jgi:hypothetical protein
MRTPRGFGLELAASVLPGANKPTDSGDAEFRAGYAEARGCAPLKRGALSLDTCLGIWNGVMRARGVGFRYGSFSRLVPIAGAHAHLRAGYTFDARVFVRASGVVGVPFVRDRFVAEGAMERRVELQRAALFLWSASLAAGVHLR